MSYNPDAAAVVKQQPDRFPAFLSQRDLSLAVPVNFVTHPGVVLTAACFSHGQYGYLAASKCISNLLATGFRRIEADLFWDASLKHWSLCPVELGDNALQLTTSTSAAPAPTDTSTHLQTSLLTTRTPAAIARLAADDLEHARRQASTIVRSLTTPPGNSNPAVTSAAESPSLDDTTSDDALSIQVGPYTCDRGTDFDMLVHVMSGHLGSTENDVNATTVTLTLNIHAAAPALNPGGSALRPADEDLPDSSSLLSYALQTNTSVYLYTPSELLRERGDLNKSRSWFGVPIQSQPESVFFTVEEINGHDATPDGWPSENYLEMELAQRMLVNFGDIDPQMANYNFAGDEAVIFPSNYLEAPRAVATTSQGIITSGCFFAPGDTSVASANSSWAINVIGNGTLAIGSELESILSQASNLAYCGISPILNTTLNNVTANQDTSPYSAFVDSTIWSWGPGQPLNASASPDLDDYRCAALNLTTGTWQASDCTESRRGACRIGAAPYSWTISSTDVPYDRINLACGAGTTFDVPRTSLENSHLLSVWRGWKQNNQDDDSGALLWMDFNDLDVTDCWVIGQNATCPYSGPPPTDFREVVVPVVGGIIVFVLAGMTILVKCAGNRQQSRRKRRRGDDGGDYEGVPS